MKRESFSRFICCFTPTDAAERKQIIHTKIQALLTGEEHDWVIQ